MSAPLVTVYLAPGCHLCHDALVLLRPLSAELGFRLEERDITLDDALHRAYLERIPVVALDGEELFDYFVDAAVLRERLRAVRGGRGRAERAGGRGGRSGHAANPGPAQPPR